MVIGKCDRWPRRGSDRNARIQMISDGGIAQTK